MIEKSSVADDAAADKGENPPREICRRDGPKSLESKLMNILNYIVCAAWIGR